VLVIYRCQEKKVLEHQSGLRPSDKKLPEWHSGTIIPVFDHITFYLCFNLQ
jgi:hypothetical protein